MKRVVTYLVLFSLLVSVVLMGCQSQATPSPTPTKATATATAVPTKVAEPTKPASEPAKPTAAPTKPTAAPTAAAPATPIKIGVIIPLTGALMHEGPLVKKGIDLALEHYNWEVAGRKVEIIVEDSATDPTTALDKARKLVERDKVSIVIGPQASNVAQAVQPYLMEKKIISLKSRQFPIALTQKFPYYFIVDGTQEQVTAPMGLYAYNVLKYKTIATMTDDYVAGRAFMGGFVQGFKEAGGTIVQEQYHPNTTVDFATYLTSVKTADALCAWTGGPGGARLLKQYVEYGLNKKMPLIAPYISGILNEDVIPTIGDAALGVIGPSSYASTIDNPLNKKVVADWKKKYNERPGDCGVMGGYVNIQVVMEALKATRGDTDADKMKEAILKLSLDTPAGKITFTPDRLSVMNIYINKVVKEGGEYFWQVIHTYPNQKPR